MAVALTEHLATISYSGIVALANPDALVNNKMFQRVRGQNYGNLKFKGTYTGSPSTIYGKVIRVDDSAVILNWTAFTAATIAGGNWSGTLPGVPQGNSTNGAGANGSAYKLMVNDAASDTGATTSTCQFRVGINMLLMGQSNAVRLMTAYGSSPDSAPAFNKDCWFFNLGTSAPFTTASAWTQFAANTMPLAHLLNKVNEVANCPVSISWWARDAVPSGWFTLFWNLDQPEYLTSGKKQLEAYGNNIEFILWNQGESDSGRPREWQSPGYSDDLNTIHVQYVSNMGLTVADVPWLLTTVGSTISPPPGTPENEPPGPVGYQDSLELPAIAWEVQNTYRIYPNIKCVQTHSGETLQDNIHHNGVAATNVCKRFARAVTTELGLTLGYCTPKISAAAVVDARTTRVTVTHGIGTDITGKASGANFTGFEVWSGSAWLIGVGNRVNATTIDITTSADATTTSARKIRYAGTSGGPGSNGVRDNGDPYAYLMPTSPEGFECSGLYNVADPTFISGYLYIYATGWNGATSDYPVTWQDTYIAPTTEARTLIILHSEWGNGADPAQYATVKVSFNGGAQTTSVAVSRNADISLFTVDMPAGTSRIKPYVTRANGVYNGSSLFMWSVPTALMDGTPAMSYVKGNGVQTSVSLTPNVSAHASVVGMVRQSLGFTLAQFSESEYGLHIDGGKVDNSAEQPVCFERSDALADASALLKFNALTTGAPAAFSGAMAVAVIPSLYTPGEGGGGGGGGGSTPGTRLAINGALIQLGSQRLTT